ncbi:transmembrane protein 223 [Alligator mississippiensis]|uniref:Transmembrane protein 223 n=1 Tax=Alligator mississippiensis TaxID=8496 RepID=A0A151NTN3_ALLMI|nr:transmembrane protein 223 [Alligator mississippiensis]
MQGSRSPTPVAPASSSASLEPFTSNLWRYGFCGSCLAVGFVVVGGGLLFSRRSVRQVVLHRGGQAVTLRTHSPFGLRDSLTVPLRDVSCRVHRSQVPAALPVKVRGVTFYFLLDRAGQFLNPQLFDLTVGAYRKL